VQNDVAQVQTNGTTSTGLQGATVASARADEETALAQADGVRVQISKATIVSPIAGVVVNRNLNIRANSPARGQIFTLQETDRVYAVLNGAGSQIVGIANGSPVNVTSGSLPGRSIRGTVVGVLNAVTPGSTNFIVKVLVANGRGLLRPGWSFRVRRAFPVRRGPHPGHRISRYDEQHGANRARTERCTPST